jgi:hypothetical protein
MAGSALGGVAPAVSGSLPGQGPMRNGVFQSPNIAPEPAVTPFGQAYSAAPEPAVTPLPQSTAPQPAVTPLPQAPSVTPQSTVASFPSISGKGGASGQPAMPTPTQGQYAPLSPQGNFNVNQASAGALQQSMQGAQAGMGFQPGTIRPTGYQASTAQATGYNPSAMTSQGYGASTIGASPTVQAQNVQAGQLAGSNLSAYTNPYEDQVVQQTLSDLKGAQEKELNQMGAQATAANAFGGSRQGIAEAETRKGYADKAAQAVSGLRQAGFTQAQQMAQADIGTAQQAALANQQANLAAGTTTAGFGQQSNLSNQAALNAASQFGSSAANQAAATNMAAQNAAAQFGAGAANQMGLSNMGALNAASQYNAGNAMSAQQQNVANQMAAQGMRMGAGAQLGQLGQQAFGVGQTLQQNQAQQGLLQQGLQQALIDAARGQYAGYTGAPSQALSAPLAALGVTPVPQSTTTTNQRGLFDYLGLAAGAVGMSDTRLKTDIKPVGTHKGINLYTWSWNDEGKRIADPAQPTIGVMAQELRETHPHLVKAGEDGYLRVDYVGLNSELEAA